MKKLLLLCCAVLALAATSSTGMVLTRDSFSNGPNDARPTWCYHEDSFHLRIWTGTLAAGESFTVPVRFCTTEEVNPYGPSNSGVLYEVAYSDRQSLGLSIAFPDGTVKQSHLFAENWLAGCVVPSLNVSTGHYIENIPGGTYQVTLTNTGTKPISSQHPLTFEIRVDFIDVNFQQTLCPAEDRRLV